MFTIAFKVIQPQMQISQIYKHLAIYNEQMKQEPFK